jgi:hypothetical protein
MACLPRDPSEGPESRAARRHTSIALSRSLWSSSAELDKFMEPGHTLSAPESMVAQLEPDRAMSASRAYEAVAKSDVYKCAPATAASLRCVGAQTCTRGAGGIRGAADGGAVPLAAIIILCCFLAYAREASTCPDLRGMMGTNWLSRCWISCARWCGKAAQFQQRKQSISSPHAAGAEHAGCVTEVGAYSPCPERRALAR